MRSTFGVYERLKKEQHIDTLFRTGKACSFFPLKFVWLAVPRAANETSPVRIGFSIPKRKFKKSTERHRVRRLLVEAWRLQKAEIYPVVPQEVQLHVFILYTSDKELPFEEICLLVRKGILALTKAVARKKAPVEPNSTQQAQLPPNP